MLVTFMIVVVISMTGATLRKRLVNLETRVSLDAIEFRNDISDLKDALNKTCSTVDTNVRGYKAESHSSNLENQEDYLKLFENLKAVVRRGFAEEKEHIRKSQEKVNKQNEAILSKLNSQEDSLNRLHVKQNAMDREVERLKDSLSQMYDTVTSNKEKIEAFEDKLKRIAVANNNTIVKTNQLVEDINEIKEACQLNGWVVYRNSCYKWSENKLSWTDAVNSCKSMGGYLAEIDDEHENAFAIENVRTIGQTIWLGASDIDKEGTYVWNYSNGELDYLFTGWNSGEPNGGTNENCVTLETYHKWNDRSCLYKLYYVCEKQLTT